jgi:glutamate N-acetyltransferase/amino-acid N-acetyltransferase
VIHSRRLIAGEATPSAVVLNSGGANACTGQRGMDDAVAMGAHVAAGLGVASNEVLVCSTGIIGEVLDMGKVAAGAGTAIAALAPGEQAGLDAATAIMTTDTVPKMARVPAPAGYKLGGMAKGAGMLAPGLATMLVVLTTDALVAPPALQAALGQSCRVTFDRTDSDGCMSTNDTVILLASGESGVVADPEEFEALLTELCADLAHQLIGDAEGADHDIEVRVTGALTEDGAVQVARAIARSNLFKTAIAGRDPNWGRILAAAGTVPSEVAPYQPERVDVTINGVMVCRGGGVGESRDLVDLAPRKVDIVVNLNAGRAEATILTNDLTHEYIHINADYST